jgi:hypothetical protein
MGSASLWPPMHRPPLVPDTVHATMVMINPSARYRMHQLGRLVGGESRGNWMSLAEHSSKVSHVDDYPQDVSTLMTLVELKIHLVSFC